MRADIDMSMNRRSFLSMAPAAVLASAMPQCTFSADSPISPAAVCIDRHQGPTIRIMGAGSMGLRVTKALQDEWHPFNERLYGATVKPNAALGSRLLVVFNEEGALSWGQRAREIQGNNLLLAVCGLGIVEDRSSVPTLEELAYLANQAGVHLPVAVVSLPFGIERRGSRRLWAFKQLQEVRKTFKNVLTVDANSLPELYSLEFEVENAPHNLEREVAACVATIRSMGDATSANLGATNLSECAPSISLESSRYAAGFACGPEAPEMAVTDALLSCRTQFSREEWNKVRSIHAYVRYGKHPDILLIWKILDELRSRVAAEVYITAETTYRPAFGQRVEVRLIARGLA